MTTEDSDEPEQDPPRGCITIRTAWDRFYDHYGAGAAPLLRPQGACVLVKKEGSVLATMYLNPKTGSYEIRQHLDFKGDIDAPTTFSLRYFVTLKDREVERGTVSFSISPMSTNTGRSLASGLAAGFASSNYVASVAGCIVKGSLSAETQDPERIFSISDMGAPPGWKYEWKRNQRTGEVIQWERDSWLRNELAGRAFSNLFREAHLCAHYYKPPRGELTLSAAAWGEENDGEPDYANPLTSSGEMARHYLLGRGRIPPNRDEYFEPLVGLTPYVIEKDFQDCLTPERKRAAVHGKQPSSARRTSWAQVRRDYKERVDKWPRTEPGPSESVDLKWLKKKHPGVTRKAFRDIRRELTPADWLKRGRRKQSSI